MRVVVLEDSDRLGTKRGEVYEAGRYPYEPDCKVSLSRRIPDGYDPCCNHYACQVAEMAEDRLRALGCSCGCRPLAERQAAIDANPPAAGSPVAEEEEGTDHADR